jgi:hypothetical protein
MRAQSFLLLCLLLALCGRDAVAQSQDEPPDSANSTLYRIDNMPPAISANEKAYIHGISTGLTYANFWGARNNR